MSYARRQFAGRIAAACAALIGLSACGGSGSSSPFDNPPLINNSPTTGAQKLCFEYFQRCVNPIFLKPLPVNLNGVVTTNTCAGAGCHDNANGTGGAFRVIPGATVQDLSQPANTPAVLRTTDMYKNFYSAQGEVIFNSPLQSRLLAKPQVQGVLHGGGLIFLNSQDPNLITIQYWIEHPSLLGEDEFGAACKNMFTPADPVNGQCN